MGIGPQVKHDIRFKMYADGIHEELTTTLPPFEKALAEATFEPPVAMKAHC